MPLGLSPRQSKTDQHSPIARRNSAGAASTVVRSPGDYCGALSACSPGLTPRQPLWTNSTPEMLRELRSLDAELELIRFGVHEADQRGEALRRLEQTRRILKRAATSF